jgi:hypothetical protein
MTHAILVCEPEPYWTPELQRRFLGTQITVRGCRKWSELETLSRSYGRAVRLVDFHAVAVDCLPGMAREADSAAPQPLLLLVDAETAELEWVLREGGAGAVLSDRIPADDLVQICRRWLQSAC